MFLEAGLLTRRSVRKFDPDKKISDADMADVLKIAMYAPSGCNKQSWRFVVVDDAKRKEELMQNHPHIAFLREAAAGIVVCGDTNSQCDEGFWVLDCATATQNLLLALHGKGLGGCWCAVYPYVDRMAAFQRVLNLPDNIKPLAIVVAGYPAQIPPQPQNRYSPDKVHHNQW